MKAHLDLGLNNTQLKIMYVRIFCVLDKKHPIYLQKSNSKVYNFFLFVTDGDFKVHNSIIAWY